MDIILTFYADEAPEEDIMQIKTNIKRWRDTKIGILNLEREVTENNNLYTSYMIYKSYYDVDLLISLFENKSHKEFSKRPKFVKMLDDNFNFFTCRSNIVECMNICIRTRNPRDIIELNEEIEDDNSEKYKDIIEIFRKYLYFET